MAAIGLALVSAILFGGMSVALRVALSRHAGAELATLATLAGAVSVAVVAVALETPFRGVHARDAWPFALAGLLQPGVGQLLVTLAIREAGASRASVVFGAGPLVSVTIALVVLGEPLKVMVLIGAALIVSGAVALASERDRPGHIRRIGLLYAGIVDLVFATRDNLVRWLARGSSVPPATAAAATLLAGSLVLAAVLGPRIRSRPALRDVVPFLGAGVCFGLSYVSLFEAFYRGRVTVVSPIVGTESLWGVVLAVLFIRHTELVGRRLLAGALLVVLGGALIGAFR